MDEWQLLTRVELQSSPNPRQLYVKLSAEALVRVMSISEHKKDALTRAADQLLEQLKLFVLNVLLHQADYDNVESRVVEADFRKLLHVCQLA